MRIVVVGDTLLDVDLIGTAQRLSPDGPVPVLELGEPIVRAGGAGLVATLLARDGHEVVLVTALADDAHAQTLRGALNDVAVLASALSGGTPVKTRVRAGGHAVARLDENCARIGAISAPTQAMLAALHDAEAIVAADYGRGLLADPHLRAVLTECAAWVPLVWDPHPRGTHPVPGAWAVTPNHSEAAALWEHPIGDAVAAADAALALADRWQARDVIVTMGEGGAVLGRNGHLPLALPVTVVAAADSCGAGDRFAASLAVALANGAGIEDAAAQAAADAAGFLAAGGVATLRRPHNAHPLHTGTSDALRIAHETRARGGTVVATGGCFDLLHAGHVRTLAAARNLGDCLIVCLNSDASVRRLKGSERPLIQQDDRVDLLRALSCVDAVVVFDEDTPIEMIRRIEPAIWVKGGDYRAEELPETQVLAEFGGRVVTVPYHPARSTSKLAEALARVG